MKIKEMKVFMVSARRWNQMKIGIVDRFQISRSLKEGSGVSRSGDFINLTGLQQFSLQSSGQT
jgi:hypothetical protein